MNSSPGSWRALSNCLLLLLVLLPACAATRDHQAELLLHPNGWVQGPSLLGAAPGVILGAPLWGLTALIAGGESDTTATAIHLFAYPGALLLGTAPWLIAGPSWERVNAEPAQK